MRAKKVISVWLSLIMIVITCYSGSYIGYADDSNAEIYSDYSNEVSAGDTIKIPVSIKNNTGLMGFMLNIDYDTEVITPTSIEYGSILSGGIQDNLSGDAVPGSFKVYWAGSENNSNNGILFYINAEINPNAVGRTTIQIGYSQDDTFDESFKDVVLDCNSIELIIQNNKYPTYAKINAVSNDVKSGDNVSVKFYVEDIKDITETSLTLAYDKNTFEYVSSDGANSTENDSDAGIITVNASSMTNEMINTNFISIKFKCKESAVNGLYAFDLNSDNNNVFCTGCQIEVKSTGVIYESNVFSDSINGYINKELVIPIKIENNYGIMGYKLSFRYDSSLIQVKSVENSQQFIGNFDNNIGVKNDSFDVLWLSTSNVDVDGTLLILKFDVLTKDAVNTTIDVSYSEEDTFNENYTSVLFNCNDVQVKLNSVHNHRYETEITKETTCTTEGEATKTCSVCGDSIKVVLPKKEHNYKTTVTKATLKQNGIVIKKCSDCGDIASTTSIAYPKTIKLKKTKYRYNGKAKKPVVIVTDSNGKPIPANNYTVKYAKGRKKVGKYAVKITFKGNYSGTKTLYFAVVPKSTSISKLTAGKKRFKVTWKKQTKQTTGYQIQYATNSKFTKGKKTITVKKNKTIKKTVKGLKAKKKYFVRIRTYKVVNGKKYYSVWSKAKTVKTKK